MNAEKRAEAAEQKTKQEKYRREKDVHADEIGMQYAPRP